MKKSGFDSMKAMLQIRFCKKFLGSLFFGDAVDKDIHEESKNKLTTKFATKDGICDRALIDLYFILQTSLALAAIFLTVFLVFKFHHYQFDKNLGVRTHLIKEAIIDSDEESTKKYQSYLVDREAKERLSYVISTFAVFTTLILTTFLWQKYFLFWLHHRSEKFLFYFESLTKAAIAVCGIYLWFATFLIIANSNFLFFAAIYSKDAIELYWHYKNLYEAPLTFLLSFLVSFLVIFYGVFFKKFWQKKITIILATVIAILAFFISSFLWFDRYNLDDYSLNFSPVVYPIVQTYLGKMPLIDLKSLYGLYPIFLQPLLHLFTPTVESLSAILALLLFISLLAIAFCLFSILKNKLIALLAFFAFTYLQYFANTWLISSNAIAFQYEPIRFLFPSLLLVFLSFFLKNPSKGKYYFGLVFFALSTMWNIDSGVPTFITLVLILGYEKCFINAPWQKFNIKTAISHLACSLFILTACWSILLIFLNFSYRQLPNLSWLFYGQKAAFEFGYAMLPILPNDIWCLAVLIYVIGAVFAAHNFVNKKYDFQNNFILVLTLLGVGLFTYFLGRSHISNIFHCSYLAIILLAIFADKFCTKLSEQDLTLMRKILLPQNLILAFPLFLLSYLFTVGSLHLAFYQPLQKKFYDKFFSDIPKASPYWLKQSDFIKNNIVIDQNKFARDDILILSLNDQDYYFALELKAKSPYNFVNLRHIFYQAEFEQLKQIIIDKKIDWIILPEVRRANKILSLSDDEILQVKNLLQKNYRISAQLKENNFTNLTIFKKK
ncbi:MAG: hypothetical protein SFV53_02540 [Rickettsiales bacterium]|nr:hypothetical protein [Rickettsiales bacterium]